MFCIIKNIYYYMYSYHFQWKSFLSREIYKFCIYREMFGKLRTYFQLFISRLYNIVCVSYFSRAFNEKDFYNIREIRKTNAYYRKIYSRTSNNIIYRACARGQTATSSRTHNRIDFNFRTVASRSCLMES